MLRALLVGVLVAAPLAAAAPASAGVLVNGIPRHLTCGDPIKPGILAQPGTLGSHKVKMKAIDRRTGRVWWRKTAKARARWRYWYLPSGMDGRCRPTTIVYTVQDRSVRYRVSFRREAARR